MLKIFAEKSVRLRDTFAGKMRLRILGPHPSCEKVVEILPAKVSLRCPYQVIIFSNPIYLTWFTETYNCGHTAIGPKIVTWYGHLRDTFAGKISTTFSQLG